MRNLKTIIALFILVVCSVQAGSISSGVVEEIDLKNGLVLINNIRYKIDEGKTHLISGEHRLKLKMLKTGSWVNYVIENSLVTVIRLKTPYVFNE